MAWSRAQAEQMANHVKRDVPGAETRIEQWAGVHGVRVWLPEIPQKGRRKPLYGPDNPITIAGFDTWERVLAEYSATVKR